MECAFEFGGRPQDVVVTATGVARVPEFRELYQKLCADSRFRPGMRILLDLCQIDMSVIPLMDAPEIGDSLVDFADQCEGCAIAVVAKDPLTAVLIRAAELGHDLDHVNVWVACSRPEATAWLESQVSLSSSRA
jgi:hypothetical protein